MGSITIISTFPFVLHMMTAAGVVFDISSTNDCNDVISYWIYAAIKCYSLVPVNASFSHQVAYIQVCFAVIAFLAHLSDNLQVRKIGYTILLLLYIITQLRHLIWGYGVEVISYLFTHIAVFCTLVLYNDTLMLK